MRVHIYEPSSNSRPNKIVNIKDEGNHLCGVSFSVSFETNMQSGWTWVLISVPRSHCLHSIRKWSGRYRITWTGLRFSTRITDLLINQYSPVSIPRFRRFTCDLFTSCVFSEPHTSLCFGLFTQKVFPYTASDLILQIHGVQQYRLGGYSWTAKLGDTRILEPFDFAVTFLFISSPSSTPFISFLIFTICQIEILMYNISKHCGAHDIYTLLFILFWPRQWSVWFSIILLIAWFHYGGFQGLADMYSWHFPFSIYFIYYCIQSWVLVISQFRHTSTFILS